MIPSLGPEHPYTIAALDARGAAELMLGKLDEAVATETLALQLTERAQGVEHPDVAFALDKLGAGLRQLNRLPEARVALERSVKLRSRNPNDPYYGASLINLGDLERVENHMEKAYELNKRATDVLLRTLGPEHQYVTEALQGQSWLALELGHPREALDTAKRALASVEKHPESQYWPILLTRFGEAQSALGAHDEAIAALEKAIATVAKWPDAEPQTRAEPRFALAIALRAAKRDNARSIALAKEARALYAPIPLGANDVARIDAWLAGDRSGPH
jgi:tetratricopeptide (TPR) repeat protein